MVPEINLCSSMVARIAVELPRIRQPTAPVNGDGGAPCRRLAAAFPKGAAAGERYIPASMKAIDL